MNGMLFLSFTICVHSETHAEWYWTTITWFECLYMDCWITKCYNGEFGEMRGENGETEHGFTLSL